LLSQQNQGIQTISVIKEGNIEEKL